MHLPTPKFLDPRRTKRSHRCRYYEHSDTTALPPPSIMAAQNRRFDASALGSLHDCYSRRSSRADPHRRAVGHQHQQMGISRDRRRDDCRQRRYAPAAFYETILAQGWVPATTASSQQRRRTTGRAARPSGEKPTTVSRLDVDEMERGDVVDKVGDFELGD